MANRNKPFYGSELALLLLVFGFSVAQSNCAEPPKDEKLKSELDRYWDRIAHASGTDGWNEGNYEYWPDVAIEARKAFADMYSDAGDNKEQQFKRIRDYVRRFGTDGPKADFRWILAAPNFLLDNGGQRPPGGENMAQQQAQICECEVRAFLSDRKKFERYYNALLWSQMFLVGTDRQGDQLGILSPAPRRRPVANPQPVDWWFARRCMLFFHAVGRDDLLDHITAEKVTDRYPEWFDWVKKNRVFMRAETKDPIWRLDSTAMKNSDGFPNYREVWLPPLNLPKKPFRDWGDKVPVPPAKIVVLIAGGE